MDNFANDSLSHDDDDDWPMGGTENGRVLSESEMKEKVKNVAKKYLKKIKTLQQNKRRQDTRIERLTRENRSLREKLGVQAAYLDVLCGFLGEDVKEKFKGRQGIGILGGDTYPAELVDRVKESVSVVSGGLGGGGIIVPPSSVNGLLAPTKTTGGGLGGGPQDDPRSSESTPSSLHNMDGTSSHHHHHHPASFSSGLLLDHDHPDSFVTDLDDEGQMSENHLYCIEDISQQDSSSLFIC